MSNAKILLGITDSYDPEVRAMLMAKYSRSYASIETRLPNTKESIQAHKEALNKYYVGYGHKSVSQLGMTDIYIEGVSMLAEKAIQNTPLYNGQSSSTRYIDFTNQPMVHFDNPEVKGWQERFRAFYVKALPLVIEKIKLEFPFASNEGNYHHKEDIGVQEAKKRTTWENTIKARAFDICRGILPAGCTTNVAFTGTFDTINDHFGEMLFHPSPEMGAIALEVLQALEAKYHYAAIPIEKLRERFKYVGNTPEYFYNVDEPFNMLMVESFTYKQLELDRAKWEKYPSVVSSDYRIRYSDIIDFGSYRDIHRHRNGVITMPLLMPTYGFNSFYMTNLPTHLQDELGGILKEYEEWANGDSSLSICPVINQYCTPMGYNVPFSYTCDLNQMLYMLELRSGKTVHQTLRKVMQTWAKLAKENVYLKQVQSHVDFDEDNFTLRRGEQVFRQEE